MPEVRAFRGMRYSAAHCGDIDKVLCPPYDVISLREQERFHERSPHNMIRLVLGRQYPSDGPTDNRYTRAAATLQEWIRRGILFCDKVPSLYVNEHTFTLNGRAHRRRGLLCIVRLQEFGQQILPHEHTLSGPKADRFRLLESCQANLSPVLMLYRDADRQVAQSIDAALEPRPLIEVEPQPGELNRLYAITNPASIQAITDGLLSKKFYIADGHHRYETALAYARRRTADDPSPDAPFQFVLTLAIAIEDPGLVVLPYHRLLTEQLDQRIAALPEKLKGRAGFEVERLPTICVANAFANSLAETPAEIVAFGLLSRRWALLVRFLDRVRLGQSPRGGLDVTAVDELILKEMLGLDEKMLEDDRFVQYCHDEQEAVAAVRSGRCSLAILMRATRLEQLLTVAEAGEKMPRKSTYFYPKPWCGLVLHHFACAP